MRDRKLITDSRDTPGLCTRWKTRHFRTSPLKRRLGTQSKQQLASLPSLLPLQSSVTSKITQEHIPQVQIMLTIKPQFPYGAQRRISPSCMVQEKRRQPFWALTIGYYPH